MFTGLVGARGEILRLDTAGAVTHLALQAPADYFQGINLGASVCVDGVCLSVVDTRKQSTEKLVLSFDLVAETLERSTFGWRAEQQNNLGNPARPQPAVNLERSLRMGDELGGHIVAGHVMETAHIVSVSPIGTGETASLDLCVQAGDCARYLFPKGFLAINGVSLTLGEIEKNEHGARFHLHLIPDTLRRTNLGELRPKTPSMSKLTP